MPSLPTRFKSAAGLLCVAGLALAGCKSQSTSQYPSPGGSTMSSSGSGSDASSGSATDTSSSTAETGTLTVPAGARTLAAGSLPLPAFYAPPEGGQLYIYDIDSNTVAKITSYGPLNTNGGESKPLNLNDLPNATNNLDPTHKYRVYYVPSKSVNTLPSTLPASP